MSEQEPVLRTRSPETIISTLALLAMALLPLLEVAVRKFYASGIPGSAMFVQHLVLWVAFLGAFLAARRGELLSLATGGFLRGRRRRLVEWLSGSVGFTVCLVLAWGSWQLVQAERLGGRRLALEIPVWTVQLVMPFGFLGIALMLLWRVPGGRARLAAACCAFLPLALHLGPDLRSPFSLSLLLGVVLVATALGAPIFVGLGGTAAVLLWHNYDPLSAIPSEAYNLSINPILPTIPLFTLAGYILAEGGTPRRLVSFFRAWFGWIPGGVAVVAILVCAFFTSFTGGSGVTILAMGGLLYPMLLADQHPQRFSTGLLTSAGSLGLLLPPSLAVILYSVIAQIDVRRLFVSGLVPALLELTLVSLYIYFFSKRTRQSRRPFQLREAWASLRKAAWELTIPVVLLGSILGGLTTLVEAAAVTVLYAFILEFFIRRELRLAKDLLRVVGDAAALIGGVLIILGVAMGLTNYLVFAEIPEKGVTLVQSFVDSRILFLLLFNLFLLLVGCVMDIYSAITVVVPLVLPLGTAFGVDPFHLGIIFLTNLELGYLTPPVGMNLFLASYRFKRPLPEVYRASLPFLAIRAVAVLLITYLPFVTGFLPGLMGMK